MDTVAILPAGMDVGFPRKQTEPSVGAARASGSPFVGLA
jgi:hypothetical protein